MKIKLIYDYIISDTMNRTLKYIVIAFIFCQNLSVNGQNVSYSPYSVFGIGDIETADYSRNLGMGGVGIGLKSKESLNRLNPASYSGIDSLSFTLESSFSGRASHFYNGNSAQNNSLAGLKKLAVGFCVNSFWHTSAGVVPFSNMGYDMSMIKTTEGAPYNTYELNLTGNGSINRFYLANSFNLSKNLSVGVNLSFLFGTLTQDENITTSITNYNSTVETKSYLHRIYPDFGVQ
jgi:hypothetical protein